MHHLRFTGTVPILAWDMLQASSRPLYEQLEEQKAKKDAEYDAVTKAMFAPTKALDEEEAQHLEAIDERRRNDRMLQNLAEAREVDGFKAARLNHTLVSVSEDAEGNTTAPKPAPTVRIPAAAPKAPALDVKIKLKAKKRRIAPLESGGSSAAKRVRDRPASEPAAVSARAGKVKGAPAAPVTVEKEQEEEGGSEANPLAALGGYGSSDSD